MSERFDALYRRVLQCGDYSGVANALYTAAFRESLSLMLECLESPLVLPESFLRRGGRTADAWTWRRKRPIMARRALGGDVLSAPHR